jgi:hypothetical protein
MFNRYICHRCVSLRLFVLRTVQTVDIVNRSVKIIIFVIIFGTYFKFRNYNISEAEQASMAFGWFK